jgi:glycosyltransferase involved in cell wall biosynthesis
VKNPSFSIIIPTYNRADLIIESIKSIQNQKLIDWECIIVDDGSTDNTKTVIEDIIRQDSRIKYVYQENAERSAARNNGIRNSSGEYICFLDSDDHFIDDHLEKLKAFIDGQKEAICMVINQSINVSAEEEYKTSLNQPSSNLVEFLYLNPVSPSRVCVHKNILNEFKFDEDIIIVEDVILWMKIADKHPVFVSDHFGVRYNIHDGNSVNKIGKGVVIKYYGVILAKKRYPELFKKIPRKSYKYWTSRIQTNVAYHHILNDNRLEGIKWLLKALLMKPIHKHTKLRLYLIIKLMFFKKVEV